MKKIIPILIFSWIAYLVFTTSCANPGNPVGGDKDTIPPDVVETRPEFNARSFDGNTVSLTFNEFIVPEGLSEVLLVSPPLPKRAMIRTKQKTLFIDLGENLKENTTYSIDFKDAIVDNNEKNPLEDFRFAFSTGENFDSLMIGGYVKQAKNLEPVEEALVVLHKLDEFSAFTDSIPDYIAKTDEDGFYILSNIAEGSYRMYAILDADNSLGFNQPGEQIAFYDTLVVPHDWNVLEVLPDSARGIEKRYQELPTPHFLMMYEEDYFDQFLDTYKRDKGNHCFFYFSEALTDSFKLELIQPKVDMDFAQFEYNETRDSLQLWMNDTVISKTDTLVFKMDYVVKDTLDQFVYLTDTLEMLFKDKKKKTKKKKKKDDKPRTKFMNIKSNLGTKTLDIYRSLKLEMPESLAQFNEDGFHLFLKVDTLEEELDIQIREDSLAFRTYYIDYPWEYEAEYRFLIDSASLKNYAGNPNNTYKKKFIIQKEGYYASILLNLSNVKGASVVQLLSNREEEDVLQEIQIEKDGEIEFPLLKPEKYKIRLFVDDNKNGEWDLGEIEKDKQPEAVIYYQKILKLRSNFRVEESWSLPENLKYQKELIDEDKEKSKSRKKRSGKRSSF